MAQALGGHHHHHGHGHAAASSTSDSDTDSTSSTSSTNSKSQVLSQIVCSLQVNSTQNDATNPIAIIENTLANAGYLVPAGNSSFTDSRGTLIYVKEHSNVTLSLPEPLLGRFRVYAAKRNQSMTGLMAKAISRMMDEDADADAAKRRILARLRNPPGRLPNARISWSRDELYDR